METGSWVLVVIALVLLIAGTLRYDWLLAVWRDRFRSGARAERLPVPPRGSAAVHHAAAHTGHVSPHGAQLSPHAGSAAPRSPHAGVHGSGRRKPVIPRGARRHRRPPTARSMAARGGR